MEAINTVGLSSSIGMGECFVKWNGYTHKHNTGMNEKYRKHNVNTLSSKHLLCYIYNPLHLHDNDYHKTGICNKQKQTINARLYFPQIKPLCCHTNIHKTTICLCVGVARLSSTCPCLHGLTPVPSADVMQIWKKHWLHVISSQFRWNITSLLVYSWPGHWNPFNYYLILHL